MTRFVSPALRALNNSSRSLMTVTSMTSGVPMATRWTSSADIGSTSPTIIVSVSTAGACSSAAHTVATRNADATTTTGLRIAEDRLLAHTLRWFGGGDDRLAWLVWLRRERNHFLLQTSENLHVARRRRRRLGWGLAGRQEQPQQRLRR